LILAENQVLPASLIFLGPFAMLTGIGLFSFFSRIR